jgi:PAS domain S-box-containing protein
MSGKPGTAAAATEVLANLPTPVVAHDAAGTIAYANAAFREVSIAEPIGMAAETVLDGYQPDEGGGFVVPAGTDERFVAVVRTPTRVQRGEPSATTVLALRPTRGGTERLDTPAQYLGTERTGGQPDPGYASIPAELPGAGVSADEVLMNLATPVLAHNEAGSVVYANEAFRRVSVADPTGQHVTEVLDRYAPGGGSAFVSPANADKEFAAALRRCSETKDADTARISVLALRLIPADDRVENRVSEGRTEATGRGDSPLDDSYERVLENANDSVFVMSTAQDEFVYVNRRACEMLGYERSELLSITPRDVHPHDYPKFHEFMERVVEDGSDWTTELSCYHSGGEIIPAEVSATVVEAGGRRLLVANVRDISTRVEQREELRRLSRAMDATTEGIALFDRDGTATYANPAFADAFGVADAETVRGRTWAELFDDGDRFEMAVRPAAERDSAWTDTVQVSTDEGERHYALSVTASDESHLCVARDTTERRRRVDRLRGLTAASRAFMDNESVEGVAETAVSVIEETLGYRAACVRLYDPEANRLERRAESDRAAELLAEEVAYDMDASRAGRAFKSGERVVVEAGDDAYAADRSHLHVPVGETGVVTVATPDGFRESDAESFELVAETLRAAIARVERLERLREREAELDRRRDELATVVEFNDLVEDVIRSVVSGSTRRGREQAVCDRLAGSDRYVGAWILDEDRTVRAKTVGADVTFPAEEGFVASAFADRLLGETSEGISVERRRFDAGEASEVATAAAVPITYAGQEFGTVIVLARGEDAFPDAARSGVEVLAETLGLAVVASRSQTALRSSDVTEVVFTYSNLFTDLSAEYNCRVVFREGSTTATGELVYRGVVEGLDAETVRSAIGGRPDVRSVAPNGPDKCTVRVRGTGRVLEVLTNAGANVRSLVAEGGTSRVTAEVPNDVDVSDLLDRLQEQFNGVSLHSKRSSQRLSPDRVTTGDALTNRQREVTCTAYELGYYEWPREHTAEEVAEALDVAPSTFHEHLRTAQHKLAEHLCESGGPESNR